MSLTAFASLFRDKRGSTLIQFVLVLPIFVILVFGSYEIWKLVHLKQTLEAATIQATRYLSVEGPYLDTFPGDWQSRAWTYVAQELDNEPLLRDELESAELTVDVNTRYGYGAPECPGEDSSRPREALDRAQRSQFHLVSRLRIGSPVRIPLLGSAENLVLTEEHWYYLECGPSGQPTPVP